MSPIVSSLQQVHDPPFFEATPVNKYWAILEQCQQIELNQTTPEHVTMFVKKKRLLVLLTYIYL